MFSTRFQGIYITLSELGEKNKQNLLFFSVFSVYKNVFFNCRSLDLGINREMLQVEQDVQKQNTFTVPIVHTATTRSFLANHNL